MRQRLPDKRRCETFTVQVNQKSWHITVGYYPDGKVGEVFFVGSKVGSDMRETMDLLGMAVSLALQHGVDIGEFLALMWGTSDSHALRAVASGLSACSSVVEQAPHKGLVAGSTPAAPTEVSASEEQA